MLLSHTAVRRVATYAAGAALAAGALVAGAGAASAAPADADLTGVATNVFGNPLANIGVIAYSVDPADGSADDFVATATTDAAGKFTFTELDAASLAANDDPAVSSFKLLYYDNTDYGTGIAAYRALRYQDTYLGAKYSKKSTTVSIPAAATTPVVVPNQPLVQSGGINLLILGPNGQPVTDVGSARIFNSDDDGSFSDTSDDDDAYDNPATDATEPAPKDGVVTFAGLEGGQSYRVSASGSDFNPTTMLYTYYLSKFAGGGTLGTAPAFPITPGVYTNVVIQLSNGLTSVEAPSIVGNASFGSTLQAVPGTWAKNAGNEYTFQWLRGSTLVATGPTYPVTKADKGAKLRLLVTAFYGDFVGSAASSPTAKVGEKSKVKAKKLKGGDAIAVTVKVSKKKIAKKLGAPTGKVVVLNEDGDKASKAVKLKGGQATLKPNKLATGKLTVAYLGGKKLGPDTATLGGGGGKGGGKGKGKKG